MNLDINTLLQLATTLFSGVVGWMFKGLYADFKKTVDTLAEHNVRLAVLEEKVANLEER